LRALPYSDVILSGSWDGHIKVWKLSEDKRSLEPAGALCEPLVRDSQEFNGVSDDSHDETQPWLVKGIVNDISVFERGDRGRDGLCVVAAIGKEHRLGKWKKVKGARNGAVVFEIPRIEKPSLTNGNAAGDDTDE
jgi:ribosomal RNA-processing protein 9